MGRFTARRTLTLAGVAAAVIVAACATPEPPAATPEPPPPPPPPPPALALNGGIAEAAAVYVTFIREVGTIQSTFSSADEVQAAIRKGSAFEPVQLARGLVAYGAVLALQSPEYVAGVREFAADPETRAEIVARIIADPAYAATLPGADHAAGLIVSTLGTDIQALSAIGSSIKEDAYKVQERNDPRRRWATTPVSDRPARLETAKSLSSTRLVPSAEEASRLFDAAHSGSGLNPVGVRQAPPYTPVVIHSLAIAALAALGAGGEDGRALTDALVVESNNEFCFNMTKLNLFQCLAAARPNYEDMFCVGQHIVSDIAACTAQATLPPAPQIATADGGAPAPAAGAAAAADQARLTAGGGAR